MGTHEKTLETYNHTDNPWLRGPSYAHTYVEKPAMYAQLPDLKQKSVLCIGCGSGEECLYMHQAQAGAVTGIDIASTMIDHAKKTTPGVEFCVMDMENITLPETSFDFVYSSLALHYVSDWRPTLGSAHRVLKERGHFLFSVHHPVFGGAYNELNRETGDRTRLLGFEDNLKTGDFELFGDYTNVRPVQNTLRDGFEVVYYHKPFSSMLSDIRDSSFQIVDCVEPKPTQELQQENATLFEIWSKIPLFIIFHLIKA